MRLYKAPLLGVKLIAAAWGETEGHVVVRVMVERLLRSGING